MQIGPRKLPGGPSSRLPSWKCEDLLSANITASFDQSVGVLYVEGTDDADQIRIVQQDGSLAVDGVQINLTDLDGNVSDVDSIDPASVGYVEVDAFGGDDTITIDEWSVVDDAPVSAYVYAGDGNDWIDGGMAADVILGEAGDDYVCGWSGDDTLFGGEGTDILDGWSGNDAIYGSDGDDQIYGGDGNDTLFGEFGEDLVEAGPGNDLIYGGYDPAYGRISGITPRRTTAITRSLAKKATTPSPAATAPITSTAATALTS